MNTLHLLLRVLLFLPLVPAACSDNTAETDQDAEQSILNDYRIPVTSIRIEQAPIKHITYVQGLIEAINAPEIKSKISAEVIQVNADEGDKVKQGDVLARLDDEGFRLDQEAAQADIQRLQALQENQQSTLSRNKSLFRQKVIADTQLDDARSSVLQTKAQLSQAHALLKKAEYQLSHTQITAPISGIVQQRSVSKGDYVNPMSPTSKTLFQIVDTHHLRARLYFPESLAHKIRVGMPVILQKGNDDVVARIQHIRPMLEEHTKALHALADFENTKDWKPGESITASVVLEQHEQAMVIPQAAVVRRPAGLVVYRLSDNKAREIPVTTGIRQGSKIEILSGAETGDLLALDGAVYLSNGVAVEIKHLTEKTNDKNETP